MGLEQLRAMKAQKVKDMRAVLDSAKSEGRKDLSADESQLYDAYAEDVKALERQIQRAEELERLEAESATVIPAASRPSTLASRPAAEAKTSFENLGEFLAAVRFNPNDQRLHYENNPQAGQSMGVGPEGGFMVPKQFLNEVLRVDTASSIVRPRARVIPAGSPPDAALSIPALDQSSSENMYGGVTMNWIGEGVAKPETDFKLREIELKPKEIAGHVVLTDKLLRNWQAADGFVSGLMRDAIIAVEDQTFLTALGGNRPLGAISSANGARIAQVRSEASKIKYIDIVNMYAKAKHGGNLVFVCNQTALPQIMQLEDGNGNNMYMPSAVAGAPATLLGHPLVVTPRVPSLGTTADISLLDLSYYLIKDGSGIFVDASPHVHFVNNKTVIKAFWNVDGQPWLLEPIREEDGNDYSPFVVLSSATS